MHVQMEDCLPAVRIRIDDDTITVMGKMPFASDLGRSVKQMPKHFLLIAVGVIE
jgi:hypothetical protein